MKNLYLIIAIVLFSFHAFSQSDVKWGKYSKEELSMTSCSFEEDAKAMILYEDALFSYKSKRYVTSIHRRIKIFDKSELKRGIVKITYDPSIEEIIDVEGITSVMFNGNEVVSKLREDQVSTKKISDKQAVMTVKIPVLRPGAIIEYRYKRRAASLSKPADWKFQHDIPTLHSSYRQSTDTPKEFDFYISFEGRRTLTEEIYKGLENVSGERPTTLARFQNGAATPQGISRWELKKVNSLKSDDPFLLSPQDYLERIVFRKPGDNNNANSWSKFATNYLRVKKVSDLMRGNNLEADVSLSDVSANGSTEEKLRRIHTAIKENYKWSGKFDIYPDNANNSADVNLKLYAALNNVFVETYLILTSTPTNGMVYQGYPLEKPFDHVVVQVIDNGKTYFIDATSQFLPFEILPTYSNGRPGLTLTDQVGWTNIASSRKWKNSIYQQITFTEKDFTKSYNVKWDEVNTSYFREEIAAGNDSYYKKMFAIPEMREVKEHRAENVQSEKGQLNTKFVYEFKEYLKDQEKIYLNPIEFQSLLENPMTEPERSYPVQYQSLPATQVTSVIDIPAGYAIESLPESVSLGLPGSYGKFTYKALASGDKINLLIKFEILKNDIPPEVYPALKGLYQSMTDKCKESIVLKKL
ncbi:MAG: DUF3857 domain-containing protein [Bacteroidota bacterium]